MAKFPELEDPEWISKLTLLVDMRSELNALNLKLHGPNQLVTDLLQHIDIFDGRLEIIESNIKVSNFTLLPTLKENPPIESSELLIFLANLRLQFSSRFADIPAYEYDLMLFSKPLMVNWRDAVNSDYQLELMELQCDPDIKITFDRTLLKKKVDGLPLVEFCQSMFIHLALTQK